MKKGDVVVFKENAGVIAGMKGVVWRKSKRTAGLTVELLESRGAFIKGDTVNVAEYEVQSATQTR